jgi:hypothetical protein
MVDIWFVGRSGLVLDMAAFERASGAAGRAAKAHTTSSRPAPRRDTQSRARFARQVTRARYDLSPGEACSKHAAQRKLASMVSSSPR